MHINQDLFASIVKHTPLISIDLIVYNSNKKVLLGYRNNLPARDTWFVPGGRIRKNERFAEAFNRITFEELGVSFSMDKAEFKGVFEHHYPGENFAGLPDFGTHYVVLAFALKMSGQTMNLPNSQHCEYKWSKPDEILFANDIHQNVKNYFNGYTLFS
mgnify:CR=1 FL=1